MQILFLVSAHNSLSQRAWIALTELGHDVTVAVVDSSCAMETAVWPHAPDLIVCPFLKTLIPESIWRRHYCLIVHPGPRGDRGPSSLDWAIELDKSDWGVTVLQATGDVDAGEVWATQTFSMRKVGKSSLYRHEVRRAAVEAVLDAIDRLVLVGAAPSARSHAAPGPCLPLMGQEVRAIDWQSDRTERVLRKVHAGDGHPGVLDTIDTKYFHLFGAHPERTLRGRPGELIGQRNGAICRATVDRAVWITHLKRQNTPAQSNFKLLATHALALAGIDVEAPEVGIAPDAQVPDDHTYREIAYHEHAGVGYLRFAFYNGAMSTEQCGRLREAFAPARAQQHTRVIVLLGGDDYFSNGIHLNEIEAADNPAQESPRTRRRLGPRTRGHRPEPLLPAHGWPIRGRSTGPTYCRGAWGRPRRRGSPQHRSGRSAHARRSGSGYSTRPSARTSRTFGRPLLASPNGPRMTGCTRHAWRNLQAIDDLVKDVLETDSHLVVSALAGDAGLRRMTYVSTAYVAGDRRGRAHETELDVGQGFRNAYEQSKLEAERRVWSRRERLPVTVVRPSIVVGERGTGWTTSFNVVYGPLRAFANGTYPVLPGRRDAALDIVTVDHVADAILALAASPAAAGGTYHVVGGERATTLGDLARLASRRFDRRAPRLVPPGIYRSVMHPLILRVPIRTPAGDWCAARSTSPTSRSICVSTIAARASCSIRWASARRRSPSISTP